MHTETPGTKKRSIAQRVKAAFIASPTADPLGSGFKRPEGMDRETYRKLRAEKNERLARLGKPRMVWVSTQSVGQAMAQIRQMILLTEDRTGKNRRAELSQTALDRLAAERYTGPGKVNGTYRRQTPKPKNPGKARRAARSLTQ